MKSPWPPALNDNPGNAGSYNHLPFIFLSDNDASYDGLICTITNFIVAVLVIQHSVFKLQFLKLLL